MRVRYGCNSFKENIDMAVSVTSLRTSCENIVEAIFEDCEFEKQIRKKYWWLPVVLPPCLRNDSSSGDLSLSGRLSSDIALWLVELRHACDSDDLFTSLKLRVGSENTSDEWHFGCRHLEDSAELGASDISDNFTDSDTYSSDLSVLSNQQLERPDLSSQDVVVDGKGVVLDHVNGKSSVVISLNTPEYDRTKSGQDSFQFDVDKSFLSGVDSSEEIPNTTSGGVGLSWIVNPSYTAIDVGGLKWQCGGDCNREREAGFRKLCQSALDELSRTTIIESAGCEVKCSKYSAGTYVSDRVPSSEESGLNDRNAHCWLVNNCKSEVRSSRLNNESDRSDNDISSGLIVGNQSSFKTFELNDWDDVYQLELRWQVLFTSDDSSEGSLSALNVVNGGASDCTTDSPINEKCDGVLHDLQCMMHCLQVMEDSYASRNNEVVTWQENQDVEFLLLCDNADNFITETLECYKSQWVPHRKETSSSFSDEVFLSIPESNEANVVFDDATVLKGKENYHFNINAIFDDGIKPPIPPLRKKKKEKNLVGTSLSQQDISSEVKVHLVESCGCHSEYAGQCNCDQNASGNLGAFLGEGRNSCCEFSDLCSNELLTSMSSGESILLPDDRDAQSKIDDSMASNPSRSTPVTSQVNNDSLCHSSLLEVKVPQARPILSFEFPPCTLSETCERDGSTNSLGRTVKQRIRPVVSLQDFSSNLYEDTHYSCSSLDRSRKGSGSSDIAAWKQDLQRSGLFSQDDECLQSDEWFLSTDREGRVYYFEENSAESSWTLPKISIDDSEVSLKKSLPEVPTDTVLRGKEGEKRSSSRITKARSLLVNDKKQRDSSNKSSSIPRNFLVDKSAVLKEGPLNRTKITENGKKVRKNWAIAHVVLREQFLVFLKESKSVQPELVIELNEVVLESGEKMSKRKNVFLVSTAGLQVLCQAEDSHLTSDWCSAIKTALENLNKSSKLLSPHSPDEEQKSSLVRSRSLRNRTHDGNDDQMSGNEEQTKIRNRLKRFFHRRPTRETLASKGIYKDEPVFDNYLEKVCSLEHPRIPKFVLLCVRAIEGKEENMKTDGLYRASGNLSHVQKIRLEVDQNNLQVLEKEDDVHVLTGALKLFFRELKEPLIPFELFTTALETGDLNSDKKVKIRMFQDIVQQLPDANRDTLAFLLRHLRKVTEYEEYNRMHIPNLAIVFGPTLIWREKECHQNMALEYMQQNLVIEFFLQQFDEIFRNFKLPNS